MIIRNILKTNQLTKGNNFYNMKYFLILIVLCSNLSVASKQEWDSDKSDWSKIMLATYKGNYKRMEKLIQKACEVDYSTKAGVTALIIAIRKQDLKATNILLNTGKIDVKNYNNVIRLACLYQNVEILKLLVSYKFPLKFDEANSSPLIAACSFGSKEIVEYLISIGANVNIQAEIDGITPLMLAVGGGEIEKVKILLRNGADKNIKDKNGKTAIGYLENIPVRFNVTEGIKDEIRKLLE